MSDDLVAAGAMGDVAEAEQHREPAFPPDFPHDQYSIEEGHRAEPPVAVSLGPPPPVDQETFMTCRQVADLFQVTTETVNKWCQTGELRAMKVTGGGAGRWRITRSSVIEFANERLNR